MMESLVIKLLAFRPATLLKKRLKQRCFPVNIAKFLRLHMTASTSCSIGLLIDF